MNRHTLLQLTLQCISGFLVRLEFDEGVLELVLELVVLLGLLIQLRFELLSGLECLYDAGLLLFQHLLYFSNIVDLLSQCRREDDLERLRHGSC